MGSSSTGTSTCTVSSKVWTILPVRVVTRPKMLTVPRSHAVFVLEGDVAVLDLDRDRNQHGVAGDLHEVRAHVEGHQVDADLVADDFFQVLELDGRGGLQLGELLEAVKLLGLQILVERSQAQSARCHRR